MTENGAGGHPSFDRFRVTIEVLADGRRIHFYEWPSDADGAVEAGEPPEHRAMALDPRRASPDTGGDGGDAHAGDV